MKTTLFLFVACMVAGSLSAQVTIKNNTALTLTVGAQLSTDPTDCTPMSSPSFTLGPGGSINIGSPGDGLLRVGATDGGALNDWQYCPDWGGACGGISSGSGDFSFNWSDCDFVEIN